MPVRIYYEEAKHLVIWEFEGAWTWEEYYDNRRLVNATLESVEHSVDMIINMTHSQLLPQNLMTHAGSAARNAPENIGKTIFVGSNAILRAFFRVFNQLYGVLASGRKLDFYMVATLEEAYALLETIS